MNTPARHILTALLMLAVMLPGAFAQQYRPLEQGSKIEFKLIVKSNEDEPVRVAVAGLTGAISFDKSLPALSSFDVTFNTPTLNTLSAGYKEKLKSPAYFNVSKFPFIHLVSKKITQAKNEHVYFDMTADLTINGQTQTVTIPFASYGSSTGYTFRGGFTLSPADFGIGKADEFSNEAEVFIEIKTVKK